MSRAVDVSERMARVCGQPPRLEPVDDEALDERARAIGIDEAEIVRIKQGSTAPGWDERDRAVLQAAEELHAEAMIRDETWEVLARHHPPRELVELMMIVGHYHMTAFLQNSLRFRLNDYNLGLEAV